MKRDLLLVLGILLSTASQLRPAGEICLVIWIGLMLGREAARLGPQFTPALSRLVIFWLLFAVAQGIGTLTGFAIGDVHDQSLFMHDAMAYPLLAIISMLCVVGTDAGPRLHRVAWLLVTVGSATLALQVVQAWGWIGMGSIDPWYWDRMRGWSENPNQLAILCAVLGLLSLHLAVDAQGIIDDMAKGNQQDTTKTAEIRLHAWRQAIDRGIESGLLGLGPGPHLPIPPWILAGRQDSSGEPKYLEHPKVNGTPNFEAHNTLLDILTQGGLMAVLSLVWLVAAAFLLTYRTRLDGLTVLLCGLTIFSIFHLIVRHPSFWFAIAICLVAAESRKAAPARQWS
jgi:hypothetical protein